MRTTIPKPAFYFFGIVLALLFTILLLASSCTDRESILDTPTESSITDLNAVLGRYQGDANHFFEYIELSFDEVNQITFEEKVWREYIYKDKEIEMTGGFRAGEFSIYGSPILTEHFLPYDLPWQSGNTFYYYTPFERELEVHDYSIDITIIDDNLRLEIEYFDNSSDRLKTEFIFEGEKTR